MSGKDVIKERVSYYTTDKDGNIVKIEYERVKRPPTLKQFVARRYFGQLARKHRNVNGVVEHEGKLLPISALGTGAFMKMVDVDSLITPEIEKEYKEYVKEWKKKHGLK